MAKTLNDLNEAGREQLALALILLRDFKRCGNAEDDMKNVLIVVELAQMLGVHEEFNKLMSQLPPFKIAPRD